MYWALLLLVSIHTTQSAVYIDLTHDLSNETWYWPGQPGFQLETSHKGLTEYGVWLLTDQFCTGTHVGTHMDAPVHFSENGWTVDEIPLEHMIAPAVVVDIRHKALKNPDSTLSRTDLIKWEAKYGMIPKKSVVLQCSGWSDKFQNDKQGFWGNSRENVSDFHFPYFEKDAMQFLLSERDIVGVGLESPSIDIGVSRTYPVHLLTTSRNVYILENVKDVCHVPPSGATLYVIPPKYVGASGAPVRVFASYAEETAQGSASFDNMSAILLTPVFLLCRLVSHLLPK